MNDSDLRIRAEAGQRKKQFGWMRSRQVKTRANNAAF